MADEQPMVQAAALKYFCVKIFQKLDVPKEDATVTAEVLLAADLRGIPSHGVARLRRYVDGLRNGIMLAHPKITAVVETPSTATIDAGGGLGQPVAYAAMKKAIDKAKAVGSGFVTVRNSNHYGIAGYYAMMALDHDCIGISMTNADVLVVPTFGRNAMMGTNPIAVAAPAGQERPFVMDMATSTVPRGKLEVYDRLNKAMPLGWATDERGVSTQDAHRVLENFLKRAGGGLLPLGGEGEEFSGYKGYGLVIWVDIFCALLSGAAYANMVYPKASDGKPLPANLGHFCGAWRLDAFRPADEFKAAMDDLQRRLKEAPKAQGQERIYIHGEKEYEASERYLSEGVPLNPKVADDLQALGKELDVTFDL